MIPRVGQISYDIEEIEICVCSRQSEVFALATGSASPPSPGTPRTGTQIDSLIV